MEDAKGVRDATAPIVGGPPPTAEGVASPTPGSGLHSPPALIFDEVTGELRRFVWGVVRDASLVDDVIQATYLKAVERGGAAHPDTAKGWLFRVAYREALVIKRRDAARDRTNRRLASLTPRDATRPDDGLIRAETVQAVRQALTTLSDAQRRVVLARMHGDQTFAEIAAESGMPLGTVLTHMRRALEKMRRTIDLGD